MFNTANYPPDITEPRRWPLTSYKGPTTRAFRMAGEQNEAALTELQPAKTANRRSRTEQNVSPAPMQMGGILRTTEIDITTREEPELADLGIQHGIALRAWLDDP